MHRILKSFTAGLMACALFALLAANARATTLLDPVEGKKEAQELVGKLLALQPDGNSTNTGLLKIFPKDKTKRMQIPVKFTVFITPTNWHNIYEANWTNGDETLWIIHTPGQPDQYFYRSNFVDRVPILGDIPVLGHLFRNGQVSGEQLLKPFAGSDFWLSDLGLDFLHWPWQKILKKEIKRSCGCSVLESLNPDPNSKGYSRVLTWIDNDSLGFVQAQAYDAQGNLLKEFIPKSVTKVNGQWQVDEIEMRNKQTESRTLIDFDLSQ